MKISAVGFREGGQICSGLIPFPENGGYRFHENVSKYIPDYIAAYLRRLESSAHCSK
jgi:hypothetical protein